MDANTMDVLVKLGVVGVLAVIVWHLMAIFRQVFTEKRWEKSGSKTPSNGYPVQFGPNQISDRIVYDVSISLSKLVIGQEQQTKVIEDLTAELRTNRNTLMRHAAQSSDFFHAYGERITGTKPRPMSDID